MEIQALYEGLLEKFQKIVFDDLVPKLALYDSLHRKFQSDNSAFLEKAAIFVYVIQSLEVDTFLIMAKLLDGKRSERNILKFIDFCESNHKTIKWHNGNIPADLSKKHKELIAQHQAVIGRITVRRDKFLAHTDKKYFLNREKLDEDYPVNASDLIELTRCFQRILTDHSFGLTQGGRISYEGYLYVAADRLMNQLMHPEPS